MIHILKITFFLFLTTSLLFSQKLEKVTLQLQWLNQFQFAGYYMAKEKGFYEDVGLSVDIKEYNHSINILNEVLNNHATYGIGSSSLIIDKSNGKDIKLLFSAFQSSPSVFLAMKETGIESVKDFMGKKVMLTPSKLNSASLFAMMNRNNLRVNDIEIIQHSFNIDDLINKKTDLMACYISNEPFLLKLKNIPFTIFDPKDDGFDFYSDILYTTGHEAEVHKKRAINFKQASLKGWKYAFNNIEETAEVILEKYNTQNRSKEALLYEAEELKKLAFYRTKTLGTIDLNKIQDIYDAYNIMGVIDKKINTNDLVFLEKPDAINLSPEELAWLKEKHTLRYSQTNYAPLAIVEKQAMTGIIQDYINLISKKTGLKYEFIPSYNWQDALDKFKNRQIDMLPASNTPYKEQSIGVKSDIFKTFPMAIITTQKYQYIDSLDKFNGKVLALPKNYTSYNYIKKHFPDIKIISTSDAKKALLLVQNGKAEAFVGHLAASLSAITKLHLSNLKISGTTKFNFEHVFLLHKQNSIALGIINKALASITAQEKAKIDAKWMSVTLQTKYDYTLILQLLGVAIVLVSFLLYRSRKLGEYNEKLEYSNKIILEKEKILKELNKQLGYNVSDALRDLEESHKLAKVGTWRLNVQNGTFVWNDFNYIIFGRDKKKNPIETIKNYRKFIHPDDLKKVENTYNEHLKSKIPFLMRYRVVLDDGSIKYLEERGKTSYDEKGNPLLTSGTTQDITEQQLYTIELRKKDEQILQQSRLAQMGEMLSMIAHQWRQPLSAISATTSNLKFKVMLDNIDAKMLTEELTLIDEYTQHLSKTIEDFRSFFKKGREKNIVTLKEIVNSTLGIVRISVESKNIKIYTNFACNRSIEIYVSELKQVVLNLIKNAEDILLEKEIENPYISVETSCTNDTLLLSVKDNAGGVPLDIKDKIFDPYFTTKEKKDGTGLGLYMSKIIVEEHCGGKLYVNNSEDGAVFSIEFTLSGKQQ